ncbi:TetR family transcriptional regulator [Ktedonobacter sp. SOSP1-85]|uniref:TetR/AcrR family transcriptional regulator n=1 Tax=Ktedonobacter sp. SOSP1-85 TaxID=2778367 RepID=UPI00191562F9|nr:TetR/AcrR family transcriptional regulator [Ktedonobacter sp. SOSP1-85]GHO77214.1 TetR family transcriptional regulator [Ktedonobacter sp. SOSP1-85]
MGQAGQLPLRERNKQRTVQRIIDAAFELFQTTGYHQTTMDAIAEKAEVSRATLFNYFPAKREILVPLTNILYRERVQPEIQACLQMQPTTLQALHRLFLSIYTHILTFPDLYRALQEGSSHQEKAHSTLSAGIGFSESLLAILRSGQSRGEVRTDIPLEKLAQYTGAIYLSLFFPPRERQAEVTLHAEYHADIEAVLAFLETALSPGAVATSENNNQEER